MSELDRKIEAIARKYDQHLEQNNSRVLTNNYLNQPETSYHSSKLNPEESKTPKFNQDFSKNLFSKYDRYDYSSDRKSENFGRDSRKKADENLLSGNKTIDRILERKR